MQQDPGTVATVRLRTGGTAVLEVLEGGEPVSNDLVRPSALDIGHHRHTARVGLVLGVVETLGFGKC